MDYIRVFFMATGIAVWALIVVCMIIRIWCGVFPPKSEHDKFNKALRYLADGEDDRAFRLLAFIKNQKNDVDTDHLLLPNFNLTDYEMQGLNWKMEPLGISYQRPPQENKNQVDRLVFSPQGRAVFNRLRYGNVPYILTNAGTKDSNTLLRGSQKAKTSKKDG